MQNQETVYYFFEFFPIWKVRQFIDINAKTITSHYYFLGLLLYKIIDEYLEESEELIDSVAD